jgi:hypothetical protein
MRSLFQFLSAGAEEEREKMVEKLEAGKVYRWDQKRYSFEEERKNRHAWSLMDSMHRINDGKPHKCLRIKKTNVSSGDYAEFEGVPGGLWYWPLSGFVEVKEDV